MVISLEDRVKRNRNHSSKGMPENETHRRRQLVKMRDYLLDFSRYACIFLLRAHLGQETLWTQKEQPCLVGARQLCLLNQTGVSINANYVQTSGPALSK